MRIATNVPRALFEGSFSVYFHIACYLTYFPIPGRRQAYGVFLDPVRSTFDTAGMAFAIADPCA